MLETIGKTVLVTLTFIALPIILVAAFITIGAIAPIIGIIALFLLPAIIVGIVIGRKSMNKERDE
jgi:hypothetical protein